MKRLMIVSMLLASWSVASAQSGLAVFNKSGQAVGLFMEENATHILCEMRRGEVELKKSDGYTYRWLRAENGEGKLVPACSGSINVRERPTTSSKVVAGWMIPEDENQAPDFYDCLGKEGEWYKVKTKNGKIGYVRQDLVAWWQMDVSRFSYSREYYTDKSRRY